MAFYVIRNGCYMQNNSVAAPFNVLATNRTCGNVRCFDQNRQPGKINFQVSLLIIKKI